MNVGIIGLLLSLMFNANSWAQNIEGRLCKVTVVDRESGWPVPLVELRTVHKLRFVSDNAGVIAIDEPDLMDKPVWFEVIGHGYEVPKDGFGFRGVRLTPERGKSLTVEVKRTMAAKRLGRLTGAGVFAESQKLGERLSERASPVIGCDSVQSTAYRGKRYWAWGDTNFFKYPLGVFHMTSATTDLQPFLSFEPPISLRYDYFLDDQQRPRGVAEMPGKGPTWLTGYVSLADADGRDRLVAFYRKIRPPLSTYENGLCVWNDESNRFEKRSEIWNENSGQPEPKLLPDGHPAFFTDDAGMKWLLLGNPFPTFRCPATFEAWLDSTTWEPIVAPEKLSTVDGSVVTPHSGSMAWNAYRRKWVAIFMEKFGKPSAFGELWYAEAKSPTGPWNQVFKVLTHENYTFYNPRIHADLVPSGSPILIFEGTYTKEFANRPPATPRYDYNQILYRLDLNELPQLR